MKTMVVGSGAREHALAWALARDCAREGQDFRTRVFCAPGNAGTEKVARNLPLDPENPAAIVAACGELGVGLVIIGPETSLAAGLSDALASAGIAVFGPHSAEARLESSKAFARDFALRQGIACARTERFSQAAAFRRFIDENRGLRIVLKKSGLAAGKGVLESDDHAELAAFGESVLRSDELLAEEFLEGRELSIFALCDENDYSLLPACADHKKAGAGNLGPNTGGMGALCPVGFADEAVMARIERDIVAPTFEGMRAEGLSYRGVLFFGVMLCAEGPRLLEYNVRFGDPETQSLVPRIADDFTGLCAEVAAGVFHGRSWRFTPHSACGVVVAAPGYPGSYPKGILVDSAPDAPAPLVENTESGAGAGRTLLFHASTSRDESGRLRTGGGRCFTALGLAPDAEGARRAAYELAAKLRFEGAWSRPDIGASS